MLPASCWSDDPKDDPAVFDSVTVDLSHPAQLFALGELGFGTFDVGAHAKACVGSLVETTGLRPWAISIFNSPCLQLKTGGDPDEPLDYAPLYGQECVIRMESPSQVGSIRLGDDEGDPCNEPGGGASKYKENIEEGADAWCELGDILDLEPGLKVGPTLEALEDLLATEGACDALWNTPPPGATDLAGIDQLWEVFDPPAVTPGPNVVFSPHDCGVDDDPAVPDSPRFVSLVLTTEFDGVGQDQIPIIAIAGFFIDRCEEVDPGTGAVLNVYPKCDPPGGAASNMQMVGNFMRFLVLAGTAGALDPFGTRVLVLVE